MLNVWPEDISGLVAAYSAVLGCILLAGLALDARALLLAWRQRRARHDASNSQQAELMAGAASEGEEAPPAGGRHGGGGGAAA